MAVGLSQGGQFLPSTPAPADATAGGRLPRMSEADRAAGIRFAADVAPGDRQAVEAAIAAARPEARRLVEAVDGLVEVRVASLGSNGPVGLTESGRNGHVVTLDLAGVSARNGERGVRRLVLHELGHVLDYRLVPTGMAARLDAAVPRGYDTGASATGSSATREERFAESFAKWALDDIGVDVYLGYAVPPPPLDWGVPLAELR